jgi:tRNA(Ile)-lysidine synthase
LGGPPASLDQVNAVLDVARGGVRAVQLPGGERVERVAGRLHRLGTAVAPPAPARWLLPGPAVFGQFALDAWIESGPPAAWPDGRRTAVFDADRLGPEVSVRSPRSGDRFNPIGRTSTLLVADALRLAGVPASARAARPVVCTPEQDVCWVVGYRIDDHVKVTARTRRFLWMSVEPASSTASDHP